MDFIDKPFKVNYTLSNNLSSWNEPVGIAVRESIVNMIQELENDGWYQEHECKPTEDYGN
jgi:hypothetical protein